MVSAQQMIDQAITISEQILQAIGDADLERVQQLEAQRQPLISNGLESGDQVEYQQLSRLKTLNDDIVTHLNALQQQVRGQQKSLNQGSKVSRAYLANSPK